ncbi:MAG: AAA family ATPase [Acidimicrobiaceae bacterium]|nr:AAA family ATPase [Acidimicrobiia bacterium]MCY4494040.1 AAA family ATPase [Acidimicrobiaceae bacterium]
MSDESTSDHLHLPDLSISNFRGIEHLEIPRLGRVNLIAGRNGVGKTTVLDAVRVYAARGRSRLLEELLRQREEFVNAFDEDYGPDFIADFWDTPFGPEGFLEHGSQDRATKQRTGASNHT